jgi:hypothetical protein
MNYRVALLSMLLAGFTVLGGTLGSAMDKPGPDCSQGSTEEQLACLNKKVAALEAKFTELTKESLKWNDRLALFNEDMRIYPAASKRAPTHRTSCW